jgi:hypothetical protein
VIIDYRSAFGRWGELDFHRKPLPLALDAREVAEGTRIVKASGAAEARSLELFPDDEF